MAGVNVKFSGDSCQILTLYYFKTDLSDRGTDPANPALLSKISAGPQNTLRKGK
jgi:hypothetical protein